MSDEDETRQRRFLGMVEVDSGTLLIGDPTYVLPRLSTGKPGVDYEAVLAAPIAPVQHLAEGMVLLIGGFGGDGTFPVYGEFDESGDLGRVTVEFVDPPDDA